eukprot:CAMPEP_0181360940 /NCGR_PEP_ID=MMETSP1106-20121128/6986_1 /TAXON_ID=81844 /ORGANISM="Mantoniella antarctica, Strain SL-175" /LENGTH=139 /DNA_ID=CAMNT_0023474351 /DNA_START=293 /DNA_END=712 /DNA_ORIENTATION=+
MRSKGDALSLSRAFRRYAAMSSGCFASAAATLASLRGLSRSCLCPLGGRSLTSFLGVSYSAGHSLFSDSTCLRSPASWRLDISAERHLPSADLVGPMAPGRDASALSIFDRLRNIARRGGTAAVRRDELQRDSATSISR